MIHGIHFKARVKNTMCINGLMTVEQIQQLETACSMFKYSKNLLPNSFFAHFFLNNFIDSNIKKRQEATSLISHNLAWSCG